jgi:hypothetical protein
MFFDFVMENHVSKVTHTPYNSTHSIRANLACPCPQANGLSSMGQRTSQVVTSLVDFFFPLCLHLPLNCLWLSCHLN